MAEFNIGSYGTNFNIGSYGTNFYRVGMVDCLIKFDSWPMSELERSLKPLNLMELSHFESFY